jgi:hypothetical protein
MLGVCYNTATHCENNRLWLDEELTIIRSFGSGHRQWKKRRAKTLREKILSDFERCATRDCELDFRGPYKNGAIVASSFA